MMTVYGQDVVDQAMRADGGVYLLGAEWDPESPDPPPIADCSELTEWAHRSLGVWLPDGTWAQEAHVRKITVQQAINMPGALLHSHEHVAISRGDGTTIEARGRRYGIGVFGAYARPWSFGGLVPGVVYQPRPEPVADPEPSPIPEPEDDPTMLHLIVDDDPAFPGNVHLVHVGDAIAWVRSGDALGIFDRGGVKTVHCSVAEVTAMLESIPGVGPSPSTVGAAVAW